LRSPNYFDISTGINPTLAVLLGAAVFYFAFTGFELQPTLAEEAREPKKTVPNAIVLALLVCSLLYLSVAFAVVRLLDPVTLANSKAPLADAAKAAWPLAYHVLAVIALFSTSNTVLGFLVSGSRMIYGLTEEGILPEKFKKIDPRRKTPVNAIFVAAGIALLILVITEYLPELTGWKVIAIGGQEYELIDLVGKTASLAALLVFVLINFAVIWLRTREPEIERAFKIPTLALPAIGMILTLIFIITSFLDWIIWVTTGVVILIGYLLYKMAV
jgi:amino acid transporter